jgi:hypothetical protein
MIDPLRNARRPAQTLWRASGGEQLTPSLRRPASFPGAGTCVMCVSQPRSTVSFSAAAYAPGPAADRRRTGHRPRAVLMNITLSAKEELIRKAWKYTGKRNTTINQIIRDYLARLVGEPSNDEVAREYEAVATSMPGCSPEGRMFDRGTTRLSPVSSSPWSGVRPAPRRQPVRCQPNVSRDAPTASLTAPHATRSGLSVGGRAAV